MDKKTQALRTAQTSSSLPRIDLKQHLHKPSRRLQTYFFKSTTMLKTELFAYTIRKKRHPIKQYEHLQSVDDIRKNDLVRVRFIIK